jgi:hypothetical protein
MFPQSLPQPIQDHREQVVKRTLERIGHESQLTDLMPGRSNMADWFTRSPRHSIVGRPLPPTIRPSIYISPSAKTARATAFRCTR